jgi:hypothetical protein
MRSWSKLFGLVPVVGLAELGSQQYFSRRAPDFDDYAALAPKLVKLKQTGVPVVVAPAWAEPLVRQAAPAAFPLAEQTRADDSGFASFLEVSLLGANAPELDGFSVQRTERIGKFRVSVRQNPKPERVSFDFVSAVDQGEVEIFTELGGQRQQCQLAPRSHTQTGGLHGHVAYPRQRYDCGGGRFVGVTLIEDAAYRAHRCVMTQLPQAGSVVLRFSSVPASQRLVGFAGFSYFLQRDSPDEQVELGVSEVGQALGQYRAAGVQGWTRFELTRAAALGSVEVNVRRLDPTANDFCFALEAR